jgi:hypothetical protein
VTASS